jgi:hypothetical protein
MNPKRDDVNVTLWRTLQEQELDDDVAELEAMSDEELDKYIADNGGDPAAIRQRGVKLARRLEAQHAERDVDEKKLEALRAEAASRRSAPLLPRKELLARLEAARNDPRFAAPVATMFQKKKPEASTDEELQSLIDAIELLAKLGKG